MSSDPISFAIIVTAENPSPRHRYGQRLVRMTKNPGRALSTVKKDVSNILARLGASSRTQAAVRAQELGLP